MVMFSDFFSGIEDAHYQIHVDWDDIDRALETYTERRNQTFDELIPDYQRGHVWTEQQQREYVEWKISGGIGYDIVCLNVPGLLGNIPPRNPKPELTKVEIVDGLQRLTAVRKFIHGDLSVFGGFVYEEFEEKHPPSRLHFIFKCNCLWYRKDVLNWYLALNSKGTPHSVEEIDRVRNLLKEAE